VTAIVVGVFVSSLLGSLHCAGMCGPLVAAYAGMPGPDAPWRRRAAAHAAYSSGRLAAYLALGALAGTFGAAIDRASAWTGITRAAAAVSGTLIAAWGLHAFLAARGRRVPRLEPPPIARRAFAGALRFGASRPRAARAAILGLGSALLPCGWLYAFVVTAAGTGRAPAGALVMAVFWTGTLPVMLAFAEAVRSLSGPLRRHVPAACAVVLMVLGLLTVFGRAHLSPFPTTASASTTPACHGTR
jgi:sulfite exporter TauE/SafE